MTKFGDHGKTKTYLLHIICQPLIFVQHILFQRREILNWIQGIASGFGEFGRHFEGKIRFVRELTMRVSVLEWWERGEVEIELIDALKIASLRRGKKSPATILLWMGSDGLSALSMRLGTDVKTATSSRPLQWHFNQCTRVYNII